MSHDTNGPPTTLVRTAAGITVVICAGTYVIHVMVCTGLRENACRERSGSMCGASEDKNPIFSQQEPGFPDTDYVPCFSEDVAE